MGASGEPRNNQQSNEFAVCLGAESGENPVWYVALPHQCGTHFFCQRDHQGDSRQHPIQNAENVLGNLKDLVMKAWHRQAAVPTRCNIQVPRSEVLPQRMLPPKCNTTWSPNSRVTKSCIDRVVVEMTVDGVDYAQLSDDVSLLAAFKQKVQEKVAAAAGPPITPEHVSVTLSAGSVLITAVVTPPRGTTADAVQSAIESREELPVVMAVALSAVDGLSSVMTGPKISVGNLSVRKWGTASSGHKRHSLVSGSVPLPAASVMVVLVSSLAVLALKEETGSSYTPNLALVS